PGYVDQTVRVNVSEGRPTKGLIVKLEPGGEVTGVVVDPESHPVAGAQVVALPASGRVPSALEEALRARPGGRGPRAVAPFPGGRLPSGLMGYAASLGLLGDKAVVSDP